MVFSLSSLSDFLLPFSLLPILFHFDFILRSLVLVWSLSWKGDLHGHFKSLSGYATVVPLITNAGCTFFEWAKPLPTSTSFSTFLTVNISLLFWGNLFHKSSIYPIASLCFFTHRPDNMLAF